MELRAYSFKQAFEIWSFEGTGLLTMAASSCALIAPARVARKVSIVGCSTKIESFVLSLSG